MPSVRHRALRTALQPSARVLSRTQPFITQIRQESRNTRDEKWYEPNDGGKSQAKPEDKGTTGGYQLDGNSSVASNRGLLYIGGITAILAGVYFVGLAKPDAVIGTDIKHDTDTVKHRTGSERQRVGGPERSEK